MAKYKLEQMVAAITQSNGLITHAAKRLGCSHDTIYQYAKRYPTVQAAIDASREAITDLAEAALYQQIKAGEGWAVQFYLKTQGRTRGYGEHVQVRHGGDPDAPPIATRAVFTIAIDRRRDEDADDTDTDHGVDV